MWLWLCGAASTYCLDTNALRSGNTAAHPGLLHYACKLCTNVRCIRPLRVEVQGLRDDQEGMQRVLGGKPLLTMVFEDMEVCCSCTVGVFCSFANHTQMVVEEPEVWRPLARARPALA